MVVAGQGQVVHVSSFPLTACRYCQRVALKTGLQEIGDRLTKEGLMRGGADGLAIIDAYRRLAM